MARNDEGAGGKIGSHPYLARDGHPTEIADQLSGACRFDLDPVGRVTAVHAAAWSETYAYDALGNLAHAAYPSANDDAQGTREHNGTLIRSAGRTRYEHDGQGRVVRAVRRTLSGPEKGAGMIDNVKKQRVLPLPCPK